MIDLSDGLSSDLAHLCRESKIGAKIFAEKIPVDKTVEKLLSQRGDDSGKQNIEKPVSEKLDLALHGGEDFELLFTVNPKKIFQLEKEFKRTPFFQIGQTNANKEIIELVDTSASTILLPKGFRHF
jgi:thiamine-monophosphate kinase